MRKSIFCLDPVLNKTHVALTFSKKAYLPVVTTGIVVVATGGMVAGAVVTRGGVVTVTAIRMTSSNGNISRVTGPICGEFTGHR